MQSPRTLYVFRSGKEPELFAFTAEPEGSNLPVHLGIAAVDGSGIRRPGAIATGKSLGLPRKRQVEHAPWAPSKPGRRWCDERPVATLPSDIPATPVVPLADPDPDEVVAMRKPGPPRHGNPRRRRLRSGRSIRWADDPVVFEPHPVRE